MQKSLFRGKGTVAITDDYRRDLMALLLADKRGAVPREEETRVSQMKRYRLLERMIDEIAEEWRTRQEGRAAEEKIKAVWNGHAVMRHFRVSGRDVGRLLKLGKEYVERRLSEGAESISEEEVRDHLLKLIE